VEVDNDTDAWVLKIEPKPEQEQYFIRVTADYPVEVSLVTDMTAAGAYEAHRNYKGDPKVSFIPNKGKKEYELRGVAGREQATPGGDPPRARPGEDPRDGQAGAVRQGGPIAASVGHPI
jgi:hypothetical protein